MNTTWITRIALGLVATAALVGCGKSAAVSAPAAPPAAESGFTSQPGDEAVPVFVDQQQTRRQQETNREKTNQVGGPADENGK